MDSLMLGSFRVSQLLAALSCFVAAAVLVLLAFKKHDKANLFVNVVAAREAAEAEPAEEPTEEAPAEEETASVAEDIPAKEESSPEEP